MTSMRERIARALWNRFAATDHEAWEDETSKSPWLDDADAALAAMREPTEEMMEAGGRACGVFAGAFRDGWAAAIGASCDSGSDRNGGDANAAPGEASQSGDAESGASPKSSRTPSRTG